MEWPQLPSRWDEWKIKEKLGEGAYGSVYRAERDFGEQKLVCAIKILDISGEKAEEQELYQLFGGNEESVKAYFQDWINGFSKEIQLMEKLKGITNIVSIQDYEIEEENMNWRIYIRMEFLQEFPKYLQTHIMDESEIIRLGIELCTALEYCEKIGIIHRDIKPDNIFVSELGSFKLGDFGVARQIDLTKSRYSARGTYTYMAPEVYHGQQYDQRADIYSLGLVLYRLLNDNREPFLDSQKQIIYRKDREQALQRRMDGEALPPPKNASEQMTKVILQATAYDSEQRYKSAKDFRIVLEQIAQSEKKNELNDSGTGKCQKNESYSGDEQKFEKAKGNKGKKKWYVVVLFIIAGGLTIGRQYATEWSVEKQLELTQGKSTQSGEKEEDDSAGSIVNETQSVDVTDEEVIQALNELISEAIEYRQAGDEKLYTLAEGVDEESLQSYVDGLIENANKYDNNYSKVLISEYPYYVVNRTDYIVTGTMPDTYLEYSSSLPILSYIDGEWKFDEREETMSAIGLKMENEMYPRFYLDESITNAILTTSANAMYLDSNAVFEGTSNVEVKYVYQEPGGDVILGIWIANGANYNIYYATADITVADDELGTIVNLQGTSIDTAVKAGSSCVKEIRVPLSEVGTGTQSWGQVSTHISINYK